MTPEVSSPSKIQIFDNAVNALWKPHKKYLSLDYISLTFLDFLYHLKYCVINPHFLTLGKYEKVTLLYAWKYISRSFLH